MKASVISVAGTTALTMEASSGPSPGPSPVVHRRRLLTGLACVAVAPVLAACGSRPVPPRSLDLGPAPVWPAQTVLPRRVDLQSVSASELMLGTGVVYRLDDTDPYTRRSYRDSRWAAPLSSLMSQRLKQINSRATVAAGAEGVPAAVVNVELDDCVQRFSSATHSEVTLRLTARVGILSRTFEATAAAGGDADGAVRAMAQLLDRLGVDLLVWAAATPRPPVKA
ncbi:ABC-type transport auxiliary lipoprotein family protein [Roseateles sp. SL47]|uniref:ABC-type transport auxiliary lipoprotein family protein n=1 Tax=Roseateles sp. SL47 TaxID=2995138 RepID=UPI0022703D5A|nr:ABC-type transport auxiliary lipoprotein family protein [Roseateles sp. SL47]WAC72823.1 ABC-type transport auxiliary lipoprotein family protein [Roseateles sp. SL47]